MTSRRSLARRQELVEKTRGLPPAQYDYQPHNRQQRRTLARELRAAAKPKAPKRWPRAF